MYIQVPIDVILLQVTYLYCIHMAPPNSLASSEITLKGAFGAHVHMYRHVQCHVHIVSTRQVHVHVHVD